jgi:phenylacetic acid degradation operon negative regulatory protein
VKAVRARSALFTLFGDVVRPAGGEAWLTALTACMGTLDFTPQATRTALHRMAAEGWVEPRKVGRYAAYRLTPRGEDRLEEAALRIYRLRAADWDGRWRILVCPEAGRDLHLAKELGWLGYGRLAADTWVSPHDHDVPTGMTFLADRNAHDAEIVATAWDLDELRTLHRGFLRAWRGVRPPSAPEDAFATRIRLVHHWRGFLFSDPGLPDDLLPTDWPGREAARLFTDLYAALRPAADAFYGELAAATPTELRRSA